MTDTLVEHLTRLAAEADAAVIRAEAAAGVNVPNAARPLYAHEQTARVRFADLDALIEDTVGQLVALLAQVTRAAALALLTDLRRHTRNPGALAARLAALANPLDPARVDVDVTALSAQLSDVLATTRGAAVLATLREAVDQGLPADVVPASTRVPFGRVEAAILDAATTRAVGAAVDRVLTAAVFEASATLGPVASPGAVLDAVIGTLDSLSPAGLVDASRAAAVTAINGGRAAAAAAVPVPSTIYASELLDRVTCSRCRPVDGRRYDTLEAARADYPVAGYRACEGRSRCRGTLVFVWDTEAPATLQVPGDVPPAGGTPAQIARSTG